jgi:hypothetical protein
MYCLSRGAVNEAYHVGTFDLIDIRIDLIGFWPGRCLAHLMTLYCK